MSESINVTLSTLNTTIISTDNIEIGGVDISEYIKSHSSGNSVSVNTNITNGINIASLKINDNTKDIFCPYDNYTSFEVYATSTDIAPGTESDIPCDWTTYNEYMQYSEGDIVKSDDGNTLYVCTLSCVGIKPGSGSGWTDKWKTVEIETSFSTWAEKYQYYKYDFVTCGGHNYQAKQDNKGIKPGSGSGWTDNWQEVTTTTSISPIKNGNLVYVYAVPASMTEGFIIAADAKVGPNHIVVEWGDGEKEEIADLRGQQEVSHTYTTPGKYIVKIHGPVYRIKWSSDKIDNVSRIFDSDLKISTYLWAWKSNDFSATRNCKLLKINIPKSIKFSQIPSFYGMMAGHYNLHSYTDKSDLITIGNSQGMFAFCKSLTDIKVYNNNNIGYYTSYEGNYAQHYQECVSLVSNIRNLMPYNGNFSDCVYVMLNSMFSKCKNITFTKTDENEINMNNLTLSKMLWDNPKNTSGRVWASGNNLFSTVGNSLRDLIPTSWGGNKRIS